ncbi:helix-turn-helix domain-containing protein [Nesterenkonia alba]|uniref:helix-turn-helix domain-containing protein n=1 Tax=Nesterenkonia alba TaxID=515814 RepID=UPI0003B670A2|nr:helix-turn-helix transcriptional regulator [Nesterenkonia alba]
MPQPHPSPEQAVAFGERLRAARSELGLSQEKVAQAAGISLQHLSLLERGLSDQTKRSPANPRLGVLLGLATALRVDVAHLVEPLRTEYNPHQHGPD